MKSALAILTFVLSVSLFDAAKFRCDYQYFESAEGWFKIHTTARSWSDAAYTCNLEGAELATPSSDHMKDAMMALVYDNQLVMTIHTARHAKPSYNSISEESEVLALNIHGDDQRVSQNDFYPFICYKKAAKDVQLNECGTLDNDYVLYPRMGHCYKHHKLFSSWYQARRVCDAEGGQLVIINSEEEAQVIREIIAGIPEDDSVDYNFLYMSFVEMSTIDGHTWKTLDGKTIKEAGYDFFSPGEPNNARGDEFCGSVGRNGLLFDDPCTRPMPFICEREPKNKCEDLPSFRFSTEHKNHLNKKHKIETNEVF